MPSKPQGKPAGPEPSGKAPPFMHAAAAPPPRSRRQRMWIYVEDALIVLSLLSLWPKVLRMRDPIWDHLLFVALAVLVIIMCLRLRRLLTARRKAQATQNGTLR